MNLWRWSGSIPRGYINRVKEFLEGYDEGLTNVGFEHKRQMAGLLFKNIKIARKDIFSYSFFAPFNSFFFEAKNSLNPKQNQGVRKNLCLKSILKLSDDRWEHSHRTILSFLHTIYDEIFVSNEAYLRWVSN